MWTVRWELNDHLYITLQVEIIGVQAQYVLHSQYRLVTQKNEFLFMLIVDEKAKADVCQILQINFLTLPWCF